MTNYEYCDFKILEVSGPDTIKFLQGLNTADLAKLTSDNDTLLTAFANLKGRILSLCFVKFISAEKLLLSVDNGIVYDLISWLKKYGMFSKVTFKTIDDYSLFFNENGFLNHEILETSSIDCNTGYDAIAKINIQNKLAMIDTQNYEKFLPADLNLDDIDNVVSYTKGCFMGQEVIARMHYRAKLKKELHVIKSDEDITILDLKNSDGKPLATVVNKIISQEVTYILAVFHKAAIETSYVLESGQTITVC